MRRLIAAAATSAVLLAAGLAAAAPPQGIHGTGIQRFDVFGFEGSFRLSLSATHTSSGVVVGHMNILVEGSPGIEHGSIDATPIYVEFVDEQTCVVGDITRLDGWPTSPVRAVVRIVDVPGGPDRFASSNYFTTDIEPTSLCQQGAPPGAITDGNFTITP